MSKDGYCFVKRKVTNKFATGIRKKFLINFNCSIFRWISISCQIVGVIVGKEESTFLTRKKVNIRRNIYRY